VRYQLFHNQSSHYLRGYEPGDELREGWVGEVDHDPAKSELPVLDQIWWIHNRDDRPDGQIAPSLSVGDVIVLGETAFAVQMVGFRAVTL